MVDRIYRFFQEFYNLHKISYTLSEICFPNITWTPFPLHNNEDQLPKNTAVLGNKIFAWKGEKERKGPSIWNVGNWKNPTLFVVLLATDYNFVVDKQNKLEHKCTWFYYVKF